MRSAQSTFKHFLAVLAIAIVQMLMFGTPSYAQVITTSPSALSLTVAQGGTVSGTLSLSKTGTDVHSYYISTNQGWVWLNPAYGSTQTISTETDLLTVTVNTSAMGLIPGSYSAVVYLGETGPGVSTVVRVPVSLTVTAAGTTPPPPPPSTTPPPPPPSTTPPPPPPSTTPPPPPTATPPPPPPTSSLTSFIQSFPGSLALAAPQGTNPSGVVNLQKSGTTTHSYSISTNQGWIWLNPPYGSTQTITSEIDPLTVTVNTAGLAVGSYSAVVYILESGPDIPATTLRIPVTVTVTAPGTTPPPPPSTTPPPPSTTPPPPSTTPPPPPTATPPPPPPTSSLTSFVQSFPGSLALSAPKGTNPSGVVNLQKSGTTTHSYSISTNQGWIWLNPPYGSTQTITSEIDPLTVTVNTAALAVGSYSAVVYILESGPDIPATTLRIPVSVTVTATGTTAPPPPPPPSPTGGATPPPPPPPPSSTTTTGTMTVSWSANTEADLAGYRIYVGTQTGVHPQMFDVGNVLSKQLTLPLGFTYFVVITAYDKVGNESSPSAELSRSVF